LRQADSVLTQSSAFTQLSADRQFAHLGLMLLGVLAQVNQAVEPFAPAPKEEADAEESEEQTNQNSQPPNTTTDPTFSLDQTTDTDMDMGVPISRESILASIEQDAPAKPSTSTSASVPTRTPHSRAISLPLNNHPKTKPSVKTALQDKTEPASKETSLTPATTAAATETPALPKPKKKKARTDEFDDIFGSFDDAKKPKKKKRKKVDEFDDIFGGL
jgi:hypothetical protein